MDLIILQNSKCLGPVNHKKKKNSVGTLDTSAVGLPDFHVHKYFFFLYAISEKNLYSLFLYVISEKTTRFNAANIMIYNRFASPLCKHNVAMIFAETSIKIKCFIAYYTVKILNILLNMNRFSYFQWH